MIQIRMTLQSSMSSYLMRTLREIHQKRIISRELEGSLGLSYFLVDFMTI
jgi:hypothetical protein